MPLKAEHAGYRIASRVKGYPAVGINPTKLIVQHVHTNAGFQLWKGRKIEGDKYFLTIGAYPSTGVVDSGNIAATINPAFGVAWEINHHADHDAYTITQADKPGFGWTLIEENGHLELHPIDPRQPIPPNQLFTFGPNSKY